MGLITSLIVFLATFIRLAAFSVDTPAEGPLLPILGVFGLFLVTEQWISSRFTWYSPVYLIIQTALATLAFLIPPNFDCIPILFVPLTLKAVMTYGYPRGYLWIAFFFLTVIYPMVDVWNESLEGYIMLVLFGGIFLLTGSFANRLRSVELSRRDNERLLLELQKTHRKLEEYKSRIEDDAAARTRSHMARELHDSVTQTIFTVSLAAQSAAIKYKKDPDSAREQIEHMIELSGAASQEITDLVSLFRPRSLISKGLPEALHQLAQEKREHDHLIVNVAVSGDRVLSEETSLGLYRITQEALNNISRHAGSGQAEVRLDLAAHPAVLDIVDQGRGFEMNGDSSRLGHFGLAGMADRAAEIGWKLSIVSHPGVGTHIHVAEETA